MAALCFYKQEGTARYTSRGRVCGDSGRFLEGTCTEAAEGGAVAHALGQAIASMRRQRVVLAPAVVKWAESRL